MSAVWPALLAMLIAFAVAWLELVTSKFRRTVGLIWVSWRLNLYAFVYGLIALGAMLGLDELISSGAIKLEGAFISNRWGQAIAIGLSVKALLHIRIFTVTVDSRPFPVGVESIVHLFEPWLLELIDLDEYLAVRSLVRPRAAHYPDMAVVKDMMLKNLPPHVKPDSFRVAMGHCQDVVELMELYLRNCGRKMFDLTFPAK